MDTEDTIYGKKTIVILVFLNGGFKIAYNSIRKHSVDPVDTLVDALAAILGFTFGDHL